jgi:hypothetical protein
MQGQKPTSVFAVTQQIKPQVYPKVDDEATIVLKANLRSCQFVATHIDAALPSSKLYLRE